MRIASALAALCLTTAPSSLLAAEIDISHYCLSPLEIKLPPVQQAPLSKFKLASGVVTLLYVSQNPQQPTLMQLTTTESLMKLNGYKIVPVSMNGSQLPSNLLFNTYTDPEQTTYIATKQHYENKQPITDELIHFNSETKEFYKVPLKEIRNIEKNLVPVFTERKVILANGQTMIFDYKKNVVTINGAPIEPIYRRPFLLASYRYFPEISAVFAEGYKGDVYGSYWWNGDAWALVTSPANNDTIFIPWQTSHILKGPLFFGYPNTESALQIKSPSHVYFFSADKTLHPLIPSLVTNTGNLYYLDQLNKEFFYTDHKLYELNKDASLTPIDLPPSIKSSLIWGLKEMPQSKTAAIFTKDGIYIMDKDLRISEKPIPHSALGENFSNANLKTITSRNEIFVPLPGGPQMLVDTLISKNATCNDQ